MLAASRSVSRCRPASSTSAVRRRRATSAPRRCCSQSSPRCTRCTTGPTGSSGSRTRVRALATSLAAHLLSGGIELAHDDIFDTVCALVPGRADEIVSRALDEGVNIRAVDGDRVAIAVDETTTVDHLQAVAIAFGIHGRLSVTTDSALPGSLARTSTYLTHPVFHAHHSETSMLRYLRVLERQGHRARPFDDPARVVHDEAERDHRDGADQLARVGGDPSVRSDRARPTATGTSSPISSAWLCEITGYDSVSLQPNAGSQGEYAGLLAIRAYHRSRGDDDRTVCLIPASAHGTNPASAVMAGFEVVVVACDERGQRRSRRPARQDRHASRPTRRADGHLPVHARGVRG